MLQLRAFAQSFDLQVNEIDRQSVPKSFGRAASVNSMEWSDESALELIRLYRDLPILWDPMHGEFKMARKKQDCWTNIAKEFRTDVTTVKKKIESLLTSFRRERQREGSASGEMGNGHQVYRSKWYAYKSMLFLNGKFRPRKISNTASLFSGFQPDTTDDDESTTSQQTDRSQQQSSTSANSPSNNHHAVETNAAVVDSTATVASGVTDSEQLRQTRSPCDGGVAVVPGKRRMHFASPRKRMRKRATAAAEEDPRVEEAFRIFKNLAENRQVERDECVSFGEYVGTQLKKFDARTRAIVKHRIQNALFDAEMGKFPENYSRTTPSLPSPRRHDSTAATTMTTYSQQGYYQTSPNLAPLQYTQIALPSFASAAELQNREDKRLTLLENMNHFHQ